MVDIELVSDLMREMARQELIPGLHEVELVEGGVRFSLTPYDPVKNQMSDEGSILGLVIVQSVGSPIGKPELVEIDILLPGIAPTEGPDSEVLEKLQTGLQVAWGPAAKPSIKGNRLNFTQDLILAEDTSSEVVDSLLMEGLRRLAATLMRYEISRWQEGIEEALPESEAEPLVKARWQTFEHMVKRQFFDDAELEEEEAKVVVM